MQKLFIIIINGVAESGKDTFIEIFKRTYYTTVYNFSTINKIKEIAKELGWKGTKTDKDRKFLSNLKDLWTNYNNGPFNYILDVVKNTIGDYYLDECNSFVFIHCREPKEILKLKNYFIKMSKSRSKYNGCIVKTLLLKRNKKNIPNNHADMYVENYNYDYIVKNNGTLEELKEQVIKFKDWVE